MQLNDDRETTETHFLPTVPHPSRTVVPALPRTVRLIMVVEGGNDITGLKAISRIWHQADSSIPDLRALEQAGILLFLPTAGSNLRFWTDRLAGLGIPELHLYDREVVPELYERQAAAALVNLRPACRAFVTSKRTLENYLAPEAIRQARGIDVTFGDQDDVPRLVACEVLKRGDGPDWPSLASRARRRLVDSVKRWLNSEAFGLMSADQLAARDPAGDTRSWLSSVAEMVLL